MKTDVEEEYKELKGHVIKMKKTQKWMKPINIFAGVIGNAEELGFLNISIMLELMFVITPSTAHIERSFHAMNSIKTKLRNGLSSDLLNKHMWVSQTDIPIIAEGVLQFWCEISEKGVSKQVSGNIKVPSVYRL